jgi:hypothetical protein
VADRGDALAMLRAGVANLPLAAAATLDDAKRLVTEHTPLVLCDCHFDDGRMYDLLRWMKAGARLAGVPFLAIRVRQGELDDAMYESVKIATRALGADGFVDLYRWQQRYGNAPAAQRLMERITQLALGLSVSDPDSV